MILKPREGKWASFDCSAAAQNMMLAAKSMGIGSCPIGISRLVKSNQKMLDKLDIPDEYELYITIAFGYPDEDPKAKPREENIIVNKIE